MSDVPQVVLILRPLCREIIDTASPCTTGFISILFGTTRDTTEVISLGFKDTFFFDLGRVVLRYGFRFTFNGDDRSI
jgi:hypothetical protein